MLNFGIAQITKLHLDGGQVHLLKTAGLANHRQRSLKDHGLAAHLAQLGAGAFVRARFAQRLALQVRHLVGTNHQGLWELGRHGTGFGQRQSCGQIFGGLACQGGLIDLRGHHFEGPSESAQKLVSVAGSGAQDQGAVRVGWVRGARGHGRIFLRNLSCCGLAFFYTARHVICSLH